MSANSIAAYNAADRAAHYRRDMAIMHPNRDAMVGMLADALPWAPAVDADVLDLGLGTGVVAEALLQRFPNIRITGIDGAESMLTVARESLAGSGDRVTYLAGDFRELDTLLPESYAPGAIVSSFALHHVPPAEKGPLMRSIVKRLRAGGWFLNADIVIAGDPAVESRWQTMRVAGIVERAAGLDDARFRDAESTRAFLDRLEAAEGDCPQTVADELLLLRRAGLTHAEVFWQYTREAVYGGYKAA